MDAAAKTVESLTQHVLPERPHHLSYNPHWRYRPRPDDAARAAAGRRFEEWHNTRLQYMTLVSHADRGTLLTRSYYDMREDPPKPVPREVSALAKAAGDKKKKLSLSDYKNKKTGTACAASPPEPAIASHKETDRAIAVHASPAAPAPAKAPAPTSAPATAPTPAPAPAPAPAPSPSPSPAPAAAPAPDAAAPSNTTSQKLPRASKPLEPPQPAAHGKQRQPRDGALDVKCDAWTVTQALALTESRLPPKPPSLPRKPPSPSAKKRVADAEDEARPQKRPRSDDRRPVDDAQRRRERPQPTARDAPPQIKVDRPSSSSSSLLPNGRAILKGPTNSTRNPSPTPRATGDSVNGVRPSLGGSNNRKEPTKADTTKSSVPPLLSPLHLSFGQHQRPRPDEEDSSSRKEKKKRDESGDSGTSSKPKRPEPAASSKKTKPPVVIPPLLSPTLPAAVEAELRKRKKASPQSVQDNKPKDGKDALGIRKRPPAAAGNHDEEPRKRSNARSLVVTLSIPKALRQSVNRILALPLGSKEAQSRERAGSDEGPQPPPPQARKRPLTSVDGPAEPVVAAKRPRASDVARVAATPSTPSKRATTMSRVSSGNSLAQTPGELVNATPKAAAASLDRRPNGQDVPSTKPDRPEYQALVDKEEQLIRKGKSLKHDADLTMRAYRSPHATSVKGMPGESKFKLGYVLSLEGIIAFVMAFQAQNLSRGMVNKRSDHNRWASMFPLLEFLQTEMRRDEVANCQPLYALLLLLHAVCIDELVKCYTCADTNLESLLRLERKRARLWALVRETNASIASPALRIGVSPWYTLDEITDLALCILQRWCAEESVDWTPEPMLKEYWPIKAGHT